MWIVIITALLAAVGLALILSDAFRVPTYAVAKATHNLGKRQNRKTNPLELWLREVANWLSGKLRLNEYKRLQLEADLKTADINMTPEMYTANAIVKAGFIALFGVPLLFFSKLLALLVLGIAAFLYSKIFPTVRRCLNTRITALIRLSKTLRSLFPVQSRTTQAKRCKRKPKVGYLSKKGVEALRSALGNHIFHDEMTHIFREQTDRRDRLKKDWKTLLDEILQKISENKYRYPEVEQKLLLLSDKLSRTKGKKVYGYLKRDVKDLIDSIVDLLAEDENISRFYDLWYEKKYEILRTYTSEMPPKIPLSQNKEFKSIKNDIIREAMKLHEDSGQNETNPLKKQSQTQASQKISLTVSATAVTRLFKNLCGIFRDRIDDRRQNSQPTIDKRQKKEIEEKKNAEMSML